MGRTNSSTSSKTRKRLYWNKTKASGAASSGLRRKKPADDCILLRRSPRLISKKYVQELNLINANADAMTMTTFSTGSGSGLKSKGKTVPVNNNSIPQLPPEMLVRIFKLLPTSSLLGLRGVSRTFYSLATSIYRDRPDNVQLSFKYDPELTGHISRGSSYFDSVSRRWFVKSLSNFTLILRRSIQPENSPFTRFHFGLPLKETADLADFLEVWRSRIKSLSLSSDYSTFDVFVGGEQVIPLLKILRALENLQLDKRISHHMIRSKKSTSTCKSPFKFNKFSPLAKFLEGKSDSFPALRCLSLNFRLQGYNNTHLNFSSSMEWLLKRAVNLNRFEIFGPFPLDFSGLSLFVSLGKAHLIKSGQIELTRKNVEMFLSEKDFPLAQQLKLESLTIDMSKIQLHQNLRNQNQNQAAGVVNQLLEGQKVNLTSLKIVGFLSGLKYPKMKNLDHLTMTSAISSPRQEFPVPCLIFQPQDGVSILSIFPKLKSVDFDVRLKEGGSFPSYLDQQFRNVSTLNLKHQSAEHHFQELSNLFPRVEDISFGFRIKNFPKNGPQFWNFHCLKVLKLEIGSFQSQNSNQNLDCVFTGLDLKFLQPFYKMSDEQILNKISKSLTKRQRQQWIFNLTSLTSLRINLEVKKKDRPTLSKLSWFFAFRHMEQLKRIEIIVETDYFSREVQAFDLVDGLKSLEPFVTKINQDSGFYGYGVKKRQLDHSKENKCTL